MSGNKVISAYPAVLAQDHNQNVVAKYENEEWDILSTSNYYIGIIQKLCRQEGKGGLLFKCLCL